MCNEFAYRRRSGVTEFTPSCFIAFESDEAPVCRMRDPFENVGIWSS